VLCTILSLQVQAGSLSAPTDTIPGNSKPLPRIEKKPTQPLSIQAITRNKLSRSDQSNQPIVLKREELSSFQPNYTPSFEKDFNFSFNQSAANCL